MNTEKKGADPFTIICGLLGALVLGSIAEDRTGKWLIAAVIGFFCGVFCAAVLRGIGSHFRDASSSSETRKRTAPLYIVIGSAVVAIWIFVANAPDKPYIPNPPLPHQPVSVSSYTRSDGTPVSGYDRALPGEAPANSARTMQWADAVGARMDRYESERNRVALLSVAIFGIGCFIAYRKSKNA